MHNSLINKNKGFADIEELCSFMIKEHYGSSKYFKSVDITDFIINVLGYQILYESFDGPDADAEGFTSDGKQPVYLNRNGVVELVLFPPGFIIIDKVFLQDKYKARGRFVLAHEAGHVISDKLYHNGTAGYERDMGKLSDADYEKVVYSMGLREIRANRCGAALLMPEFLFIESLKRHNIKKKITLYGNELLLPADREKMMLIAEDFNVSFKAIFNRFRDLNCFAQRDISEYWKKVNEGE